MRENALVFTCLLAAGLMWLGAAALPGQMPADYTVMRDTYHLAVICERWGHWLAEGQLAVWMPEFAGGHPVHALWMYGLFSPASLLWAVLPLELAYTWGALLHLAFGGTGLHAYLRARGVRWEAALCGAIVFALSEYVLVKIGTGGVNQLWALAWVPWVLRGIERAADGERGAVPALGLWAGFALIAGHIHVWMFMGPALAVYAVTIVVREKDGARRFARIALGALLALGMAAVQWLPAAELALAAGERPDVDAELLRQWSASGAVLAGKVLPGAFGARPGGYWGGEAFDHELAGLAGLAVLFLVLLGVRGKHPRRAFFACIAAAGLVLAIGYRSDVTGWLNSLPIIGWSRVPGRAQSLTVLGGAVLAAHGVADVLGGRMTPRAALLRGAAALAIAAGCYAVVSASSADAGGDAALALHRAAAVAVVSLLIAAAALFVAARQRRLSPVVPLALLVTVLASAPPVRAVSTAFLDIDWAARLPPATRGHRVHLADFRLPYVERQGLRTFRRPAHVEPATTRLLRDNMSAPVAAWMDAGALLLHADLDRGPPTNLADVVSVLAVPIPPRGPARLYAAAEGDVADDVALRRMTTGEDVLLLAGAATPAADPGPPGSVRMRAAPTPLEVAFETDAPGRRWLFASEKWYPGWRAEIDGEGVPLHRANVAFRAVSVPAGRHRVVFRYRPWTLLGGAAASLTTLALALITLLRGRLAARRNGAARRASSV